MESATLADATDNLMLARERCDHTLFDPRDPGIPRTQCQSTESTQHNLTIFRLLVC